MYIVFCSYIFEKNLQILFKLYLPDQKASIDWVNGKQHVRTLMPISYELLNFTIQSISRGHL